MRLPKRVQHVLACTGAMAVISVVPLVLLVEPAVAAWPATIKMCNSLDSSDTNGGSTDGKNIDIDRLSSSSYGTYSNELAPGECTGNVNDPANVRIDLTDDGANFAPDGSAMIGIDNDGIDDSQGPWDMACVDSVTASNENAVPPTEALASHANTTDGVEIRIRAARNCGANLTDHVQVCNHASSADTNGASTDGKNFDVYKTDASYNNELTPGECSNFKDVDGANPLVVDLSDDGANTDLEYNLIQGTTTDQCDQGVGADLDGIPVHAGASVPNSAVFRLYAPTSGQACGVTIPGTGTASENPSPDPTCAYPKTADTEGCDDPPDPNDPADEN